MTTAHQRDPTGYACGAGHWCSLLACQPAEAAMLALMARPCKCNRRLDQGIGDISGANPLLSTHLPNVIMAPHVAGVTREAVDRMSEQTARNILSALDGQPIRQNVINQDVLG